MYNAFEMAFCGISLRNKCLAAMSSVSMQIWVLAGNVCKCACACPCVRSDSNFVNAITCISAQAVHMHMQPNSIPDDSHCCRTEYVEQQMSE